MEKAVTKGSCCENGTLKAGTVTLIKKGLLPNYVLKANLDIDSKRRKHKKQHRLIFITLKGSGFCWKVKIGDLFIQIGWKKKVSHMHNWHLEELGTACMIFLKNEEFLQLYEDLFDAFEEFFKR